MSEDATIHQLIIDHLKKSDANQAMIFSKLDDQGNTLARLTTTVELHQKYSENLEKEQKAQREDMDSIDTSIKSINTHITKVELLMKLLSPTKGKAAAVVALASILGGNQAIDNPTVKRVINVLRNTNAPVVTRPLQTPRPIPTIVPFDKIDPITEPILDNGLIHVYDAE